MRLAHAKSKKRPRTSLTPDSTPNEDLKADSTFPLSTLQTSSKKRPTPSTLTANTFFHAFPNTSSSE